MGSSTSPPPPSPPPLPETSLSCYRVYATFCGREPGPRKNISNWLEFYNPVENTWSHVSPIPGLIENQFLKDFAMASTGDSIYIIGGRLCRKERAHASVESNDFFEVNVEVLRSVYRYDIRTDQWSKSASLSTPRYDFACTLCDDKIYVAGGQSTLESTRGVASAEVYDTSLDEWTPLPDMNTIRYKCVGVTWQGKVHVVGGFTDRGYSDRGVTYVDRSSAEVYDEQCGKWIHVATMWLLDVPPNQIVPMDGRLISSGDCLNAWKGHIEAYDGKLNIWYIVEGSQLHLPSSPTSKSDGNEERWPMIQRLYITMAPIGTHLYFLAGYRTAGESSRTTSRVHVFDTSATGGAWRCLEPIEEEGERELCSHCCVVQLRQEVE